MEHRIACIVPIHTKSPANMTLQKCIQTEEETREETFN